MELAEPGSRGGREHLNRVLKDAEGLDHAEVGMAALSTETGRRPQLCPGLEATRQR